MNISMIELNKINDVFFELKKQNHMLTALVDVNA